MDSKYSEIASRVDSQALATDLDGTLIPLEGNSENLEDLKTLDLELKRRGVPLVFVTGRHLASVLSAIDELLLPMPAAIICDVGTSIYHCNGTAQPQTDSAYSRQLAEIVAPLPIAALKRSLIGIQGLTLQEPEKQGDFKLSYYADAHSLEDLLGEAAELLNTRNAPYSVIHSVDPFSGDGLIDFLPAGVSKAYALRWWAKQHDMRDEQIVFAGDSGNDLAALTAGYRAIVVGNADRSVAARASEAHRESNWGDRLYLACGSASSGVLEGCRWFGLVRSE